MRTRAGGALWVGMAVLMAACGDAGPRSGPGTLTATILSPNGDEGAAVVLVFGPGITGVESLDGRAFSQQRGDTLTVVVVREGDAGTLRFALSVADTTRSFAGTIVEVSGPDDMLRMPLSGYRVEIRR